MSDTLKAVGHEVRNERGETVAACSSKARERQFAAAPDIAGGIAQIAARAKGGAE